MGSVLLLTSSFLTGACLALSWPSLLDVSRLSAIFKMVGHEFDYKLAYSLWQHSELDRATSSNIEIRSLPRIYNECIDLSSIPSATCYNERDSGLIITDK